MEAIDFTSPRQQANHMARYIKDPSTIRAHCLNSWGAAPALSEITAMQEAARRWTGPKVEEPKDSDALGCQRPVREPKPEAVKIVALSPTIAPFLASDLVRSVGQSFGLTYAQMISKSRKSCHIHARAVAIRIMVERGWSYPRIGRALGGRDHSTIINSMGKFDIYVKVNSHVGDVYEHHRAAGWCK